MIHDLDHEAAIDPTRVGAKAATLAMARREGLPVLPGLVVDAAVSLEHMRLGAEKLTSRGSGAARLALTAEPVPFGEELVERGARLGEVLVVRSSTLLESSGEWSGAFTSYLDISPVDLPRAVTGCWASAFSVASLERQAAAGIVPGSVRMAVLIQPALDPVAGGTAMINDEGEIVVTGIKGSPAPLLQGWSTGLEAARQNGVWTGDELVDLIGVKNLDPIAESLRKASESVGATRCEWALDDRVWLLQLGRSQPKLATPLAIPYGADPRLVPVARVLMRAGGPLGEDLILPWALVGLPESHLPVAGTGTTPAIETRDTLLTQVWGLPPAEALAAARSCLTTLLGPDPSSALDVIAGLHPADPGPAVSLLALVEAMESEDPTPRRGIGRWEPFVASVVLSSGTVRRGTPASPGIGAGIACRVDLPDATASLRRRGVVSAAQPIPNLAPLLWDAAGIVTESGSPAAHLFESARALRVPAVCGVSLPPGDQIVAVDGHNGLVATLPLHGDHDV